MRSLIILAATAIIISFPGPVSLYAQTQVPASQLLGPYLSQIKQIVFTKHFDMRGEHYSYTEAPSDAFVFDGWWAWKPGTALCRITIDNSYNCKTDTLLADPTGMIRDLEVSFDGKKILFAWKKSGLGDDYHLYEMDAATKTIRQLTAGLGYADYEGCYLPNGDIVFSSTRCVQVVDCWITEVSNLYTCDKDGKYIRRLGFDQVHTNFPHVASDGTVLYTRWEYNDRGQVYMQPLFRMNPDGTHQTSVYGINSWYPCSILHSRDIPGTSGKVVCILSGHCTVQEGKLAVIDPSKGREEDSGITLIAPVRASDRKIDFGLGSYGSTPPQWQYPYPLDENNFLVGYRGPGDAYYSVCFMNRDGRYCKLTSDPNISCNQAVPLAPRQAPPLPSSPVDYTKSTGIFTIEDIYFGPGLQGVARGTVKKLRVITPQWRAAVVGGAEVRGPAGQGGVCTPVGVNNTSWDPKTVLGEADVYSDGSAAFIVPARTPVYFQAIDSNGYVVQTMRSWSTLQPGETFGCFGCHESKNVSFPPGPTPSLATKAGPKPLKPLYDVPANTGFSYGKIIQPIWNSRCVSCHDSTHPTLNLSAKMVWAGPGPFQGGNRKSWSTSYLNLVQKNQVFDWVDCSIVPAGKNYVATAWLNWLSPQSIPPMLLPYAAGSSRSPILSKMKSVTCASGITRAELDKIACWIDLLVPHDGTYTESMDSAGKQLYSIKFLKRSTWEKQEAANIQAWITSRQTVVAPRNGENNRSAVNTGAHCFAISKLRNSLAVTFTSAGPHRVDLITLQGRLLEQRSGNGAEQCTFSRAGRAPSVCLVRITVGGKEIVKRVDF